MKRRLKQFGFIVLIFASQCFGFGTVKINVAVFGNFLINSNKISTDSLWILPLFDLDYQEKISCDSCHRWSKDGMAFFMDAFLDSLVQTTWSKVNDSTKKLMNDSNPPSRLLSLQNPLLLPTSRSLEQWSTTLSFPFSNWLDTGLDRPEFIWRKKDPFTSDSLRKDLSALAGRLGTRYFLIPSNLRVVLNPVRSDLHEGNLALQFYLVLWDATGHTPIWCIELQWYSGDGDLDRNPSSSIMTPLRNFIFSLPKELKKQMQKEPR